MFLFQVTRDPTRGLSKRGNVLGYVTEGLRGAYLASGMAGSRFSNASWTTLPWLLLFLLTLRLAPYCHPSIPVGPLTVTIWLQVQIPRALRPVGEQKPLLGSSCESPATHPKNQLRSLVCPWARHSNQRRVTSQWLRFLTKAPSPSKCTTEMRCGALPNLMDESRGGVDLLSENQGVLL